MDLMKNCYYSNTIESFLLDSPNSIMGSLSLEHAHDLEALQKNAWLSQIEILQSALRTFKDGWIGFEFNIPRMGKRVDTIVVLNSVIFVIEFKVGSDKHEAHAIEQVLDYTLDLKNFHAPSHSCHLVPLLVSTKAASIAPALEWYEDAMSKPILANQSDLREVIEYVIRHCPVAASISGETWASGGYKPTPTIIEAAQALYQGHSVAEITRFDAGKKNLADTNRCISEIIDQAKELRQKVICFVTGVPGAGKTLAGLNLVTDRTKIHEEEHAVFLSGNGPLVDVLREALARDEHRQLKEQGIKSTKDNSARRVKSFIQNIHHFRDANLITNDAPIEKVAVFDEAQRAWDKNHASKFMAQKKGVPDFDMSEPEYLISVMDRHQDWCVIVCLIGGGQEINSGEAGLT